MESNNDPDNMEGKIPLQQHSIVLCLCTLTVTLKHAKECCCLDHNFKVVCYTSALIVLSHNDRGVHALIQVFGLNRILLLKHGAISKLMLICP